MISQILSLALLVAPSSVGAFSLHHPLTNKSLQPSSLNLQDSGESDDTMLQSRRQMLNVGFAALFSATVAMNGPKNANAVPSTFCK